MPDLAGSGREVPTTNSGDAEGSLVVGHTPGPWAMHAEDPLSEAEYPFYVLANEDTVEVALVGDAANARLIAAAPRTKEERDDLLEALKEVISGDVGSTHLPSIDKARAAIKKAEVSDG